VSPRPAPKPAGTSGSRGLVRAPGAGAHPLQAVPAPGDAQTATVARQPPDVAAPLTATGSPATRAARAPRTGRARTTLYVDPELLRELGRTRARLSLRHDKMLTQTSVLEAALAFGLAHADELPVEAFPADARRTST